MTNRFYLKDAMPIMYDEVVTWLHEIDRDDLIPQITDMYITGRCNCGSSQCIDFTVESSNSKYAPINGRRPFYNDIESTTAIMIGISGKEPNEILTGFECIGDYADDYIHKRLEAIGFIRVIEEDEDQSNWDNCDHSWHIQQWYKDDKLTNALRNVATNWTDAKLIAEQWYKDFPHYCGDQDYWAYRRDEMEDHSAIGYFRELLEERLKQT